MANICSCSIVFHGNNDGIHKLWQVFENQIKLKPYEIIEKLQLDNDEYDGRYYLSDFALMDGVIYCNAEFAWDVNEDFLDIISDTLDIEYSVLANTDDDGYWVLNDDGKYFKSNYFLDAESSPIGAFEEFETESQVVDYLEKKTGKRMSAEEWRDYFYDSEEYEDHYARLWIVERD